MQFITNVPISCSRCNSIAYGRESPIRDAQGNLVMECVWRCDKCGSYLKRGITKEIEKKK